MFYNDVDFDEIEIDKNNKEILYSQLPMNFPLYIFNNF